MYKVKVIVVSTQDYILYHITGRWGRQVRINTLLDYDFEQIQVELIMSCPRTSWVSYELTCTPFKYASGPLFPSPRLPPLDNVLFLPNMLTV